MNRLRYLKPECPKRKVNRTRTYLSVGALLCAYLRIIFEAITGEVNLLIFLALGLDNSLTVNCGILVFHPVFRPEATITEAASDRSNEPTIGSKALTGSRALLGERSGAAFLAPGLSLQIVVVVFDTWNAFFN